MGLSIEAIQRRHDAGPPEFDDVGVGTAHSDRGELLEEVRRLRAALADAAQWEKCRWHILIDQRCTDRFPDAPRLWCASCIAHAALEVK